MQPDWHWSMAEIPPENRFESWFEILSDTYLACAIEMIPDRPLTVAADVRENKLGTMSLLHSSVFPHRGKRTRRHVAARAHDVIGMHFIESGRQIVELDGDRTVLGPGDAVIWDGATTGYFEMTEPTVKTTLIVPRTLAATALPSYRRSYARALPHDDQQARSLAQILTVLHDQLPGMTGGAREAAARLVIELLKPLDRRRPDADRRPAQQLREKALDYVDANLQDATLSSATIAAAHRVSVRTLYSVLDGLGMTLGDYIRHRRLARAYDDLLFGSDQVSVVSARWGFRSPAHFSRAFRSRYGLPPSTLR
jgi:AraC family transcriptional activator of tynA and feaB